LPTRYTFTGQYSYSAGFGLLFFNARWFDPALGEQVPLQFSVAHLFSAAFYLDS
jgi:hypothetical protein